MSDPYNIEGKRFVRVTSLLRARGLTDFSKIPPGKRDYYMARGCANHMRWQHVEEGCSDKYDYDPATDVYIDAHTNFLRDSGFKALPDGIEMKVRSEELGLVGTIDRLGMMNGRLTMIDYKTNTAYPSTAIQLACYLLCLPQYSFAEVDRFGVGLGKKGKYKMSERYPDTDKNTALWHIQEYWREKDLLDKQAQAS